MKFNIKEWQDKHVNNLNEVTSEEDLDQLFGKKNSSSAKLIREKGWEIDILLKELAKSKFGHKVEKWTEDNKDKRLGPAVVPFDQLLDKLKQMKKLIK
jgi:hypothetical protein